MSFGYNDIFWILSVILWTTGVTAIIILIMKRRGRLKIDRTKLALLPKKLILYLRSYSHSVHFEDISDNGMKSRKIVNLDMAKVVEMDDYLLMRSLK